MKAIGYFRETAHFDQTLPEQHQAFLAHCRKHRIEIQATYAETGSDDGGYRELLADLAGNASGTRVFVSSLAALADDLRDVAVRFFEISAGGGVVVTSDDDQDVTAALLALWRADGSAGRLSDKVRAAMRRKAVKGEALGRPPYGYRVGALRRLEVIPEEAVVVRYIYRLYLQEGLGIRLIARQLNEEGLTTRRGGKWSMVSIRDILRNRAYLGTYSRFDVHVTGTHPSIIGSDDYRRAQERLNARRTSYTPRQAGQFLLAGLVHCGYCGNKLIGVSRSQTWVRKGGEKVSNRYRYYQCESRTNQSVCGYHTRRADDLEEAVRDEIARADAPEAKRESVTERDLRHAERLRSKLKGAERRIEACVDAASRGRSTVEQMRARATGIAKQRLEDADELRRLTARASGGGEALADDRRRLLEAWGNGEGPDQHELLRRVVSRVTVTDDEVTVLYAA